MPRIKYVGDTTKIKPFRLKAGGLRIPKGDSKLMIERDVGVTSVASYDIKRIDSDYFSEE